MEIRDAPILGYTMRRSIRHRQCILNSEDKGRHKLAAVLLKVFAANALRLFWYFP